MTEHEAKYYSLDQAMADFELPELTEGAEMSLTGGASGRRILDPQDKGEAIDVFGGSREAGVTLTEEGIITLTADFADEEITGRACRAGVMLDEDRGELVRTYCSCTGYLRSYYTCRHITGLLMDYIIGRDGRESLAGTALERALAERTGVDAPLKEGILKKTDSRLLAMAQAHRKQLENTPIWLSMPAPAHLPGQDSPEGQPGTDGTMPPAAETGTGKKRGRKPAAKGGRTAASKPDESRRPLETECVLKAYEGCPGLELRAGTKRRYVINPLKNLFDVYEKGGSYHFSASLDRPAGRGSYTPEAAAVMDFLTGLIRSYQRQGREQVLFPAGYAMAREILLAGRDLDDFMALMDGRQLTVVDAAKKSYNCQVALDAAPEALHMQKEAYGASLMLPDQTLLGCGSSYMYLRDGSRILRLSADQWESRTALAAIGGSGEDVYIREKDLPAVLEALLPETLPAEPVQPEAGTGGKFLPGPAGAANPWVTGMDLTEYIPETPRIQIYLDLPQDDMVACNVKARYERHPGTYDLFDTETDRTFRNLPAEQQAGDRISPRFTAMDPESRTLYLECTEEELYDFLKNTLPELYSYGEIMISDRLKRLKIRPAGKVDMGVRVDAGGLLVSLGSPDMTRDEMIQIFSSYDRKKKYTRLKSGEFITMDPKDTAVWQALSETYRAYGKKHPEAMKLPMFRALYLEEMFKDREAVSLSEGDKYTALIAGLRQEEGAAAEPPESLRDVLRPYQKDGFAWIRMLKDNGFGGILADDMGLGKTLQVLAFLLSEKEAGQQGEALRTLIVAPASLVYNWEKEIRTFTPQLTCTVLAGPAQERRQRIRETEGGSDILITSYDLLKRDMAAYDGVHFANQIIDEAQYIKNHTTQASQAVRLIDSGFRLALTGTPIENRLSELWSIFDYLMPDFLYKYPQFRSDYELPVVSDHDEAAMDRLRRTVQPFILRRLKKDVLKDLPDKLEETITVHLEGEQRKLYEAYEERLRLYLDGQSEEDFARSKLEILTELTRLRQICCGPELFLENYQGENAKKAACLELVRQAVDGGHKVLIFSQFTSVLDSLCEAFREQELSWYRIDGSVSSKDRMQLVEAFAKDQVPIFVISLKAGGTGLNLTAADIVIHYDPWWNVAAMNQASDRAHRIGQKNTVTVYQLIAEKTVEERIVLLQQTKARLAEDVLSGEGIASIMVDKNELLSLL